MFDRKVKYGLAAIVLVILVSIIIIFNIIIFATETILAIVSILAAVVTYGFEQRRVTKVDEERRKVARRDTLSILSKAIIQHGINPSLQEIQRIIDSKARQHDVQFGSISKPEEILEEVFTQILETDYLMPEQKKKLLRTINSLFETESPSTKTEAELMALRNDLDSVKNTMKTTETEKLSDSQIPQLKDYISRINELSNSLKQLEKKKSRDQYQFRIRIRRRSILRVMTIMAIIYLIMAMLYVLRYYPGFL